jgi:2'-5' RNA ligase
LIARISPAYISNTKGVFDMQTIRAFIAIKISRELETAFDTLIRNMKKKSGPVRWVNPQSIHLTLKFLGEITPAQVEEVFKGVEKAAANIPPFSLKSGSKGAFPSPKRPRVFWIGLAETGDQYLFELQKNIEAEMTLCGFPKEERVFKPHLTVGRVKNSREIEAISNIFMEYDFPEIEFTAGEVLVMKSELTPHGARYSVQKSFPLKK